TGSALRATPGRAGCRRSRSALALSPGHELAVGTAGDKREPHLVRQHRAPQRSLARLPLREVVVADAHVPHEPLVDQAPHPWHRRARRKQRAGPVLLVQVDRLDAKSAGAAARARTGHEWKPDWKDLGGQKHVVAPAVDRLTDDPLRAAEAVDLGRVGPIDPQAQGPAHDLARHPVAVLAARAPAGPT